MEYTRFIDSQVKALKKYNRKRNPVAFDGIYLL